MKTPVLEMLNNIRKEERIPFYMPGHKLGRLFGDTAIPLSYDITEIEGADDLHAPTGAIREAEGLAAKAFGAAHTFFLVGGATAGIHAMIGATVSDGEEILVSRAIHKSAVYALSHAGAKAIFLSPRRNADGFLAVSPEDLAAKLRAFPNVKAFYLTNPDYYGNSQNLAELVGICHAAGVRVLVDEAHGAHFAFHPRMPQTAMAAGADMAVNSAHKTLPALTGSAYLHLAHAEDVPRVAEMLRAFETSSPSYLMMASLDYARAYMEEHREAFSALLAQIEEIFGVSPSPFRDSTRLVFTPKNMSGYKMAELLRRQYRIEPEMADDDHVVMIVTLGNTVEELRELRDAVEEIGRMPGEKKPLPVVSFPECILSPRALRNAEGVWIPLREAVGRQSIGMVYLYPPGIPVLLPGETVSAETAHELLARSAAGITIHGLSEDKICVLP